MPISRRFKKLLARIAPSPAETDKYAKHVLTVKRRIRAVYPASQVLLMGSRYRETAIKGHSDLDLLVRLRRKDVHWGGSVVNSTTALNNMRDELRSRLVQTDVGRDGCAVVASFGGGSFKIDIVPGFFRSMGVVPMLDAHRPIYAIPDGHGDWLLTCPEAHNQLLHAADEASRGQAKFVARLIKYWCFTRTPPTPLLGFYTELVLADGSICAGAKSYAQCVADGLDLLARRRLGAVEDPLGIAGRVPATKTARQRTDAVERLRWSASRAVKAVEAERCGNKQEACRLWALVFNGQFPRA